MEKDVWKYYVLQDLFSKKANVFIKLLILIHALFLNIGLVLNVDSINCFALLVLFGLIKHANLLVNAKKVFTKIVVDFVIQSLNNVFLQQFGEIQQKDVKLLEAIARQEHIIVVIHVKAEFLAKIIMSGILFT